ncbi:MAG: DUF1080 domain-containing protein [Limisphaerales bacterium]
MRGTQYLFLLLVSALFVGCRHTAENSEPQWRALFDGTSRNGWEMVGPGDVKLINGELLTTGGMGMLWYTREKFGDCQIRVVFKPTGEKDNSGVFIRVPNPPKDPWDAVHGGYEVQIANHGDEYHRTGCLYSFSKAQNIVDAKINEWNTMLITLDGPKTIVQINGEVVTVFTEGQPVPEKTIWYQPNRGPRPLHGYIGLQNHADNERVYFKEVSVRPLR